MRDAIIFRSSGPIVWKIDWQKCTSLSLCDAEIRATNMGSCLTINIRSMILHLKSLGYPIDDTDITTPLYNDNNACAKWCQILPKRVIIISKIRKMPLVSGSKRVSSLSHTSTENAIPPTFSQKKCVMARTFVGSETPSCPVVPTLSKEFPIPFTLCQPLLMNMFLKPPIMSLYQAPACSTYSFRNLCFALQNQYHAWHKLADILSRVTNSPSCRLLWAILWGVLLYDTPTGYCHTRF